MGICRDCEGSGGVLVQIKPLVVADCPTCWSTGTWPITNERPLAFTIMSHKPKKKKWKPR